jgi:hypothetical protein
VEEALPLPSNRSFGFVFSGFFSLVALLSLWRGGWESRLTAGAGLAAGLFLLVTILAPNVLLPMNRAWMRFGLLLHRITTPIILGLVFFLVVTPLALVARVVGKDFLRLRRKPAVRTYWIDRSHPGSKPETLRQQF